MTELRLAKLPNSHFTGTSSESQLVIETTDPAHGNAVTVVIRIPNGHSLERPSARDCKIVSIDDVDTSLSKLVEECIGFDDAVPSRREFLAPRQSDSGDEGWLFRLSETH